VARLNALLWAQTSSEQYATLFWACYSRESRVLRYVNAGHPPPLLVRVGEASKAHVERLDKGGPVVGLLPKATYEHGEAALNPGDILLLYSDGVIEAADASGKEFGEQRLLRILEANRHGAAAEIESLILEQVRSHVGDRPFDDDVTLLVVRIASSQTAPTQAEELAGLPPPA
jgi:sigma-B regulation protein RsbU (phosphoserine phosphatase)